MTPALALPVPTAASAVPRVGAGRGEAGSSSGGEVTSLTSGKTPLPSAGTTRTPADPFAGLPQRFVSKVTVQSTGCWLWQGEISLKGYARFHFEGAKVTAHRLAYERLVGPVPAGHELDHLCRVRACVNPHHLEAVTPRVNNLRSARHDRPDPDHCTHGHELTEENTYVRPSDGKRRCRTCHRDQAREAKRRSRASAPIRNKNSGTTGVERSGDAAAPKTAAS